MENMRFVRTVSLLLALLMLSFSLSACGESYKEAFIYVEMNSKPMTLDPQLADSPEELTVARSLFDTLLRYDEKGNIVPSAAESFEKSGKEYTFSLRRDAVWHDGEAVTAHDFVFAFRRAVDPKTSAPYANMLSAVENAQAILEGTASPKELGVIAADDFTLKITLDRDDPEFQKVLTSAITMPCNEKFFEDCMGKYGLTVDTTPSNGSYYVRKWTTEGKFLIRLAKNLEYNGKFEANSMRIYFTCSEKNPVEMLSLENTDLAYLSDEEYSDAKEAGFETIRKQNIFYGLFLNPELDPEIRSALLSAVKADSFTDKLGPTHMPADTLYPDILGVSDAKTVKSYITYNPEAASAVYSQKVKDGFELGNITIKHPNDSVCNSIAKELAGHWQQTMSCFINIEELSSYEVSSAFAYGGFDIMIAPIKSAPNTVSAYNAELGFDARDTVSVSDELFGNHLCYPLFFSTTNITAGEQVENLEGCIQNGILDVALLIKNP
jgi:oligopeptide transport system substrate-binding protein